MSAYETSRAVRMQVPFGQKQTLTELSHEFTLPDYLPEIKRLLRVHATPLPADTYLSAVGAECGGSMDYAILYAAADGSLSCFHQTGDYRFSVTCEPPSDVEAAEGLLCEVQSLAEQVTGRVLAPRRLAIRCRLRSTVDLFGTRLLGASLPDSPDMERLFGECECARRFFGRSEAIRLADEILCDPADAALRVIHAEAVPFVTDATCGSGNVSLRGEVCLRLLASRDDAPEQAPFSLLRRIPFSASVMVDGAEVNCEACGFGVCSDLTVTVEEGRILCDLSLSLSARAIRNERVAFLRDAYSTTRTSETAYATPSFPISLGALNGNLSLNATYPFDEIGIPRGATVVDAVGEATATDVEADRGKYYILGNGRIQLLLLSEGEYSTHELVLPFRFETDGAEQAPSEWAITCDLVSCKARFDGERLGLDAELALSATLTATASAQMLSEMAFGSELSPSTAAFTICYPQKNDTLWSVAKRYRCPISHLVACNELASAPASDSPESLAGVRFLMV